MNPPIHQEEIVQNYTKLALKYAKYKDNTHTSLKTLLLQVTTTFASAIISHQLIYLLSPKKQQHQLPNLEKTLTRNILHTRRPTEHTITIFTTKILLDFLTESSSKPLNQYQKGALTGLFSYLISRPFDQIEFARKQILINQKKQISRIEGISIVHRHDGFKGFYKHQNLLGPICAITYRSIYFGIWGKLLAQYGKKNDLVDFLLIPLVASAGASIGSFIPDKLRSYTFSLNDARSKAVQRRKKQVSLEQQEQASTIKLLVKYLISKQFTLSKQQMILLSISVLKNWIILSCFTFGQHLLKKNTEG